MMTEHHKFRRQRGQAKARGVEWHLSFEEWKAIWDASGLFHLRGKRSGQYVMARAGDVGPYSVGNVSICEATRNVRDSHINKPRDQHLLNIGTGRGWTFISKRKANPYQVMCRRDFVGNYPTQEAAEAAYRDAVQQVLCE